jgi:hypothetical protein
MQTNSPKITTDVTKLIAKIEMSYIGELINNDFDFHDSVGCMFFEDRIEIGIYDDNEQENKDGTKRLISIVEIYLANYNSELGLGRKENEIIFGLSGAFNPSNKASCWKTIHAASILKNWNKFIEITNKYHKEYIELLSKIKKQNNT